MDIFSPQCNTEQGGDGDVNNKTPSLLSSVSLSLSRRPSHCIFTDVKLWRIFCLSVIKVLIKTKTGAECWSQMSGHETFSPALLYYGQLGLLSIMHVLNKLQVKQNSFYSESPSWMIFLVWRTSTKSTHFYDIFRLLYRFWAGVVWDSNSRARVRTATRNEKWEHYKWNITFIAS